MGISSVSHLCGRKRQMPLYVRLAVVAATGLALSTGAYAQDAASSLRGSITLPSGVVATGGSVTIIGTDTGFRRTVPVRPDGTYSFPSLRPDEYRIEVQTADGTIRSDVFTLRVGQDSLYNFDARQTISTGDEIEDEIIVTAARLQTLEGGEVGVNITQQQIDSLPQISRNFLAFADLAPGVSFERGSNGATRIQGGGQRSSTVNVFIDGVGQKDFVLRNGISGQDSSQGNPFPQSAIGEYRVISQNYKAEFDQVSSAAITAVTKSGTNDFEGDFFIDFTDDSLRAKTPREREDDLEKVKTSDYQFGGSLGGPIIKDKLHFFVSYEGKRNTVPVEVSPGAGVDVADLPQRYQDLIGVFNRDFQQDLYFGKLDWSPTDSDLVQFSVKRRDEAGLRWDGGVNTESFTHANNNDETRILLRWEKTFDNWINDVRLTYEESAFNPQPERENAFFLNLSGRQRILNVGGHPNFQDKGQKGFGIQNDLTFTKFANHILKGGVKLKWVELNTQQQQPFNPQFFFNTEFDADGNPATTFNDTVPYQVVIGQPVSGLGDGSAVSDNFQFGIYLQDDWSVNDRLDLSLGLRWDYEETPIYLDYVTPTDAVTALRGWDNLIGANYNLDDYIATGDNRDPFTGAFQPRIGFNYKVTDTLTAFGGVGRSYDRNQFDFIRAESAAATFRSSTFCFETGDPDNPCTSGIPFDPRFFTDAGLAELTAGNTFRNRQVFLIDNDLKVPYADQFSLGLRSFFDVSDMVFDWDVGLSHIQSRDGFAWLLGNRRPGGQFFEDGAVFGAPFGFRPPGFGNILLGTNGLETNSNSAYLKFGKRYTQDSGWGFNSTYTYTDGEENRAFGQTFSLDYPSIDDYPTLRSAGVARHRFVMTGSYDMPWDVRLAGKFQYRSPSTIVGLGRPGVPNNQRTLRTTQVSDDFKQFDMSLTKYFDTPYFGFDDSQLRLRIDIINLFNTENFSSFIGNGASEDFGQRNNFNIGGNLPRTVKLSAGWSF